MPFFDRNRTKFGKYLKDKNISQKELSDDSGVTKETINKLSTGKSQKPTTQTGRAILKSLRKHDPNLRSTDFWDL
jgi:DNA-binding Xre family transcriptional regulator